jgi:DNA-directed RNA polymerase specialized sigma24 family protein
MTLSIREVKTNGIAQYGPAILESSKSEIHSKVYEQNRHRVYSLAFWMTDHELAAEQLMTQTFCRAFASSQ